MSDRRDRTAREPDHAHRHLIARETVDVHQHLWTPAFVTALRRRAAAPRLDGWTLHLDGEPPHEVNPRDHDPWHRAELDRDLAVALVSLSSPLGVEHLPPREAWPLIEAYHDGALALPPPFLPWAATCVSDPDPAQLAKDLDRGCVGLQVPATAVGDPEGLDALSGLLEVLAERDRPLFVHPGPAAHRRTGPSWWPAVVPYVQQMHAAWYAWRVHAAGTRRPRPRVCFALLAGLAPLHAERVARRGGGRGVVDPGVFLETSSYGSRAVDAVVREVGVDVVVNGSDQPYGFAPVPGLGAAADHAIRTVNPLRLLGAAPDRAGEEPLT